MRKCRLCLGTEEENEIISLYNNENQYDDLITKINDCVSIKITENDDVPTSACTACIEKVEKWWVFKEMCLKSNDILFHNIKPCQQLKEEFDDIDIDLDYKYFETAEKEDNIQFVENTYECEICTQKFSICFEYLDHQNDHNGELVFKCDKCPEVFSHRQKIVEHDRRHKKECPKCGKIILKSSMNGHLIKHTNKHKCIQCSKSFNCNASLLQHIINAHTDIKDHICEICGKNFSSTSKLNVHMKSHSDKPMYNCKLCSYAGRTTSALYAHMRTHSNEVYICHVCSKTFKSTIRLNLHLKKIHSKILKKHKCVCCDKRFLNKYKLTVHMRCHTGVKPYECNLCGKAFKRTDALKEHMITHGQRVWHNCSNCGRKFATKKGLLRHNCSLLAVS